MSRAAEYDRLLCALKQGGYRVTGPRRALLRLLTEAREPLSVQEMCSAVNDGRDPAEDVAAAGGDDAVNVVTVYRFANLLVDLGLARRVEFGQGYYRYECEEPQDGPHHHHLVCRRCGRVEDFHGCDLAPLTSRLEAEHDFRVESHQLELYGTCGACREGVNG